MAGADLNFVALQERLLESIRWRVQNGELTERRLAGRIGISQPHMHNILKGIRALSPEMADRIMRSLQMSVLDLFWPEEASAELNALRAALESASPPARSSGMCEQAKTD